MDRVREQLFIGLMSGTSMDSIDAAIVDFSDGTCHIRHQLEYPIPADLKQQLLTLCQPGDNEIERLGRADRALGHCFAGAVKLLLQQAGLSSIDITAIGSHGQTVRHAPDGKLGYTLQIGDPNTVALETGITTVADLRRKDVAAGGQGAPLAPGFHAALFGNNDRDIAVVNIGGIGNISILLKNRSVSGYDTGPGNVLMDYWISHCQGKSYDHNGDWAASGTLIPKLLSILLAEPFFNQPPPKSTGRELFNGDWLHTHLQNEDYPAVDIQATLLELTAVSIATELEKTPCKDVYIAGGGAYNNTLMTRLRNLLSEHRVNCTDQLGIPAQWVEACGFAWLARQTLNRQAGNHMTVTGARAPVVLGGIYYPE